MPAQFHSDQPQDVARVTVFNGVVTPFQAEEALPSHWPHRNEIVEKIAEHVNQVAAGCIREHLSTLAFFEGKDWEGLVLLLWN